MRPAPTMPFHFVLSANGAYVLAPLREGNAAYDFMPVRATPADLLTAYLGFPLRAKAQPGQCFSPYGPQCHQQSAGPKPSPSPAFGKCQKPLRRRPNLSAIASLPYASVRPTLLATAC